MLQFVNLHGAPVDVSPKKSTTKRAASSTDSYHKGWRVVGIPPGEMEAARNSHESMQKARAELGNEPKPFDEQSWRRNFRHKPVRSKPYSLPQAAHDCKTLAEKCGWLDCQIIEIKKEVAKC